ncbi:acetoacetate decarboxylase family protein [Gordonia sp. DT30]|uniref:acetoacetate decarboxylase family protein n=1 Tax=unclassified Gordonia (in: high G+C Gram-positive bacteria) TaxID=2657482 RepID=UPI003CED8517
MTSPSRHDVLGTSVTMPVEIRRARCFVAGFTADAAAMQTAMDTAGAAGRRLTPLRIRRGRGMCMLVFIDYIDGDLGPYNEFGVCFLVAPDSGGDAGERAAGARSPLRSLFAGDARALIHRLPVDGEFTLAAGRGIWGFPKILADFDVDHDSPTRHGSVSADGRLIADLTVKRGLPMPSSSVETTMQAYSQLDGVLRMTPWRLRSITGTRTRIGGAHLRLGDHEIADELRSLRLSRHALMTTSIRSLAMTFDDAEPV